MHTMEYTTVGSCIDHRTPQEMSDEFSSDEAALTIFLEKAEDDNLAWNHA